jgi:hypothetical protein
VKLYYLDASLETRGNTYKRIIDNLVSLRDASGMHIHGIGFQCHFKNITLFTNDKLKLFEDNLKYASSNGFDCIISEFDIIRNNNTYDFITEATLTQKVIHICLNQGVSLFHNWGPKAQCYIADDFVTHFLNWKIEPTPCYLNLIPFLKNYDSSDYNSKKSIFDRNTYLGPSYPIAPYTHPTTPAC